MTLRSALLRLSTPLVSLLSLFGAGCPAPVVTQLQPPPAGQGFQLHVAPFTVERGHEVQGCHFFAVPGAPGEDVWVSRYEMAQAVGSHHMNLFRVKTVKNLIGAPGEAVISMDGQGECFVSSNWADWPLVTNTQQASVTDWTLPDGVGAHFTGGELLMLQTHFVNADTQKTPRSAEVSVNFWTLPSSPQHELGTMFATNQNIAVCPGDVDKSFSKSCKFNSEEVHVIAANGHFHSRGRQFDMFSVDDKGAVGEQFYSSTSWDEPPMARGFDVVVPKGGGVQWRCSFDFPEGSCGDPKNSCCYTFGPTVEQQEHCNAFVYFWPATRDFNCF